MNTDYKQLAQYFKALAHPTRLQILDMLRQGEICVCHIERALGKRQAYISQQLMTLRETGLVASRKDGLQVFYRLASPISAEILGIAGHPSDDKGHAIIEDCPCPNCSHVNSHEEA